MSKRPGESNRALRKRIVEDIGYRRGVFERLCKHVSQGFTADSFGEVSWCTCKRYLEEFPDDWDAEELARAHAQGQQYWESLGKRQADGSCMGNSRTWFYNMANRYGWTERSQVQQETKGSVQVQIVDYKTASGGTAEASST